MHVADTPEPLAAAGRNRGRAAVIAGLAAFLRTRQPGERVLVAVDGVDGAGKTTFADELASALGAGGGRRQILRVGLDDFHNVRETRYRLGRSSPAGFWRDSYNLRQFTEYVLAPLSSGMPVFRDRGHDLETDTVLDPVPVPAAADAVVIVDGLFLHREELRGFWDYSLFLDVPFEVTAARMAVRDGSGAVHPNAVHPNRDRYVGGQQRYFAAADPAAHADLVLDNSREGTLRAIGARDVSYRSGP